MITPTIDTLPILSLARLESGPTERAAFLEELRQIAHTIGFFYAVDHRIDPELIRQMLSLSRRFFLLADADKLAVEMINSPHFRGYNRKGMEYTLGNRDWREQIDFGAERVALPKHDGSAPWLRLQGPNQWPPAMPELRDVVMRYQTALQELSIRILGAFAAALGQDETVFQDICTNPAILMKIIRYPGRDLTESNQGVGAHKDLEFVTVLLQDVQPGLQVELEGNWIDAPPMAGSFVVNMGEMLELATNGYLRATVHRVVTPPSGTDRLSVAFFFGADLSATIRTLDLEEVFRSGIRGVTRDPLNPLFREVGKNLLKSRLRSHPDVARRHHPDLV